MDDKKNPNDEKDLSDLLTVEEASALLRLKPSTIRAWMLHRRIQFIKLGGRVFLRKRDCLDLIESSLVPPAVSSEGSL
jgi:excisionase family DNA binding protein